MGNENNIKLEQILRKSIRNGFYGFFIMFLISFIYGGIYTEMISEGLGISFYNIILALIGSIYYSCNIFIPIFIISIIIYYLKENNKNKRK